MAKQTRAERKKQNQRYSSAKAEAQKASAVEPSDVVEDVEDVDAAAEAVVDTTAEDAEAAAKAAKLAEREAKEKAKREERAKKAAAKAESKKGKKQRRGPKFIWKIVDYCKAVKVEMKRVTWPTRNEVGKMSLVVIGALVFFGVLIFVVDSIVVPLLNLYSNLGG